MARDLIVFGEDWGALPSSTQHLVTHLSKSRKIVWVNSIGLRRPTFNCNDIYRSWTKLTATRQSIHHKHDEPLNNNFHVIHPRTIPAPRSQLERKIARYLLVQQIRPVIKKAGLNKPIIWTSLPTAVDIKGHLDESAWVYYCGDDFSALAGVDHTTVAKREAELTDEADLIITVSQTLLDRFPFEKTHILPHGVDYPLFSTLTPRAKDLPNDGRPIAGFYGSISEWLDLELLQTVIKRLPEWHFVFIGKPVVDIRKLSHNPNVILLGERGHSQLPSYSQHWTASLLPFKDNLQIRACNPLKLQEYLAAGRPIISTPFPALKPYHQLVHRINNADSMVQALRQSTLQTTNTEQQNAVAGHTWSARARQVAQWLDAL